MTDILNRIRAARVAVHAVEGPLLGAMHFREPSGADWIRIKQLFDAGQRAGLQGVDRYLIVPLLLCDEHGALVFPVYQQGVDALAAMRKDELAEICDLCFSSTDLARLLTKGEETAEKNYSASPN